jgi:hypothetical protein
VRGVVVVVCEMARNEGFVHSEQRSATQKSGHLGTGKPVAGEPHPCGTGCDAVGQGS